MKEKRRVGTMYLVYLLGIFAILFLVSTYENGYISLSNIYNFIDLFAAASIIFLCLLSLVCTKTFAAFKNSVMFICGKSELTQEQMQDGISAVKITAVSAILGSNILSIVQIVTYLKSLDLDSGVNLIGQTIGLVFIPLFYGMLICILAMPMYAILRQSLNQQ